MRITVRALLAALFVVATAAFAAGCGGVTGPAVTAAA
jgi:hypothetical protein